MFDLGFEPWPYVANTLYTKLYVIAALLDAMDILYILF